MSDPIETWLDLPTFGVFACLTVVYGATALVILWICFGRLYGPRMKRFDGVVAPFFTSVSVMFALLTGFLASDIADRNRQAARAVQAEAAELRNIYTLSIASASDMKHIRASWAVYVKAAIADDWPAMARGDGADSVGAAYDRLLHDVSDPRIASDSSVAVHAALLNATVRLGTARSERLAIASDSTSELKWAVVLILGFITQIAIGAVHLTKPRAQIAALAIFSVAVIVSLGLVALQEHPFAGDVHIAPDLIQALLKLEG